MSKGGADWSGKGWGQRGEEGGRWGKGREREGGEGGMIKRKKKESSQYLEEKKISFFFFLSFRDYLKNDV